MQIRWCVFLLMLACSCSGGRDKAAAPGGAAHIRADYKVWAEEGDSLVTILLQFYSGANRVQNVLLEPPSSVQFDGQPLSADSAGMTGAFYERQLPQNAFAGRHQVTFTYTDKQSFTDTFSFYPFTITDLPLTLFVKDHSLGVSGLPDGSLVRMVLTDTAAAGNSVNEVDTVQAQRLLLPATRLQALKSGPVTLHLFAEEDRPLRSGLPGQLSVSYSLSRSFMLQR